MRLTLKQLRLTRPVPAPAMAKREGHREPFLAAALAGLGPEWTVIRDCALPSARPGQQPVLIPFALVHPELGIVLLEIEPGGTDDAVQRLRMLLLATGSGAVDPDHVPVLHLRVRGDQVDRLGLALRHALQCRRAGGVLSDSAWMPPVMAALRDGPAPLRAVPMAPGAASAWAPSPAITSAVLTAALLCLGGGVALVQTLGGSAGDGAFAEAERQNSRIIPGAPAAASPPVLAMRALPARDALPAAVTDTALPGRPVEAAPGADDSVPPQPPAASIRPAVATERLLQMRAAPDPAPPLVAEAAWQVGDRVAFASAARSAPAAEALPEVGPLASEDAWQTGEAAPPDPWGVASDDAAGPDDSAFPMPPAATIWPTAATERLPDPHLEPVTDTDPAPDPDPVAEAAWQLDDGAAFALGSEPAAGALREPEPAAPEHASQGDEPAPSPPVAQPAQTSDPAETLPDTASIGPAAAPAPDGGAPPMPPAATIRPTVAAERLADPSPKPKTDRLAQPAPDPAPLAGAALKPGKSAAPAPAAEPAPAVAARREPEPVARTGASETGGEAPTAPAAAAVPEPPTEPRPEPGGVAAMAAPQDSPPATDPGAIEPAFRSEPPPEPMPAAPETAEAPVAGDRSGDVTDPAVPVAETEAAPPPASAADAPSPPAVPGTDATLVAPLPEPSPRAPAAEPPASPMASPGDTAVPEATAASGGAQGTEPAPAGTPETTRAAAPDAAAPDGSERIGLGTPSPTPDPGTPAEAPPPPVVQAPAASPTATQPVGDNPAPVAAASGAMAPALVAALIRRGDAMLALGDVSAARLLYERAAAGGSGAAALAAGRTYDPRVLENIGARSLRPDPEAAARWYRRALALGEADAEPLLRAVVAGRRD